MRSSSFSRACFKIFTFVSFLLSSALATGFFILFYYGRGLPDHTTLENYEPILSNRIFYEGDKVWRDYAKERRFFTPINLVPDLVIKAFLVAEDKNFFIHPGVDLMGVMRALIKNTMLGKWQSRPTGASTITQQVAKNFLLTNQRSFERKIKEAIMAVRLEKTLTKQRILELYLNQIYLGSGCYGITAAAEYYFHKKLDELSLSEVAYLAGLPKAPETYQAHKNPDLAKARRDWVLDRLYEEKHITGQNLILSKNEPIALRRRSQNDNFSGDYFLEATRQRLIDIVGPKNYEKGGYFLWTTIRRDIQDMAHTALRQGLESYDKRYGYRGPLMHLDHDAMENINQHFDKIKLSLPSPLMLAVVCEVSDQKVLIKTQDNQEGYLFFEDLKWAKAAKKGKNVGPSPSKCSDVVCVGDMIVVRPLIIEENISVYTKLPQNSDDGVDELLEKSKKSYDKNKIPKPVVAINTPEKRRFILEQIPEVTGGIVVMDSETGHVLALSGGYHFPQNQYNAATQAQRQPGSSFKTFVYLAALERGYSKDTQILDAPIHINLGFKTKSGMSVYSPKNYSKRYYGLTSLENGLAYSRNVMTVRLAMLMGMRPVQHIVKRFGIHDNLPKQLAMVLGAGETTLLRLTTAYAMIANGGKKITSTLFHKIEDRDGDAIYTHPTYVYDNNDATFDDGRELIAKPESIATIKEMLEQVVLKGTGKRSLLPISDKHKKRIYGKTGSTNDYKDAWFVGFVGKLVVGVFVGYPTPQTLGEGETGGRVAAPIAALFFDHYFSQTKKNEKQKESNVVDNHEATDFVRGEDTLPLSGEKIHNVRFEDKDLEKIHGLDGKGSEETVDGEDDNDLTVTDEQLKADGIPEGRANVQDSNIKKENQSPTSIKDMSANTVIPISHKANGEESSGSTQEKLLARVA